MWIIYLNNSLFFFCCNYSSFSFGIHSFTLDSPLIPFIYAHPHTQNPYMHTYVRRCGCDVGGSLCEDLMLAVFVCVYMCVCVPACVRVLVCVRVCARKSINVPLSFWVAPFYSQRTHFICDFVSICHTRNALFCKPLYFINKKLGTLAKILKAHTHTYVHTGHA